MKRVLLVFNLIMSYLGAYSQNSNQTETINLKQGFKLIGELDMEYDSSFRVYRKVAIFRNNVLVCSDSTHEFERFNTKRPQIYSFKNHAFGILLESFKAPSKNGLLYLLIQKNRVVKKELLPLFVASKRNLDEDNILEVAGVWDYIQLPEKGVMNYEPIIYYEFTQKGILLDKPLTIKKNKKIYGKFYGYKINERVKISITKAMDNLQKEMKMLEGEK
jgi:hypothetical protein